MGELSIQELLEDKLSLETGRLPHRIVVSNPTKKDNKYRRIEIEQKQKGAEVFFQFACYTDKQVFHENVTTRELISKLTSYTTGQFGQINAWDDAYEHIVLISKKGKTTYRSKKTEAVSHSASHNRDKNYIIREGETIPVLVDMGIFTRDGKIVRTMYDKFRQINRFLEILSDGCKDFKGDVLHIIDFGCGKSYLTFLIYYYFTQIRGQKVKIVGLDLKADVIEHCNQAAKRYGYEDLRFELGDINGYKADFPVDMVVTLHACDTATDYALFNAISWNASMIFSVPCCQHELNGQIQTQDYSLLTRYGIVKERFSALVTDAVRANLLEACGYKAQILEFVDFDNTPKNLLIRAVKKPVAAKNTRQNMLREVEQMMEEYHLDPTLYRLLKGQEYI